MRMQPLLQSKASNHHCSIICDCRLRIIVVCRRNLERVVFSLPTNILFRNTQHTRAGTTHTVMDDTSSKACNAQICKRQEQTVAQCWPRLHMRFSALLLVFHEPRVTSHLKFLLAPPPLPHAPTPGASSSTGLEPCHGLAAPAPAEAAAAAAAAFQSQLSAG